MVLKNASNGQYQITNKLPLFPNTYDFLSFFKGKIVFHYLCLGGERVGGGGGGFQFSYYSYLLLTINLVCDIIIVQ